jgi:hypothetical protein
MRPRLFFPIFLLVLGFIVLVALVYTAPGGTTPTYLSLITTAPPPSTVTPSPTTTPAPLPNEPLVLVTQNSPLPDLVWVNATGTFRRQLTNGDENDFAVLSPDGNIILIFNREFNPG